MIAGSTRLRGRTLLRLAVILGLIVAANLAAREIVDVLRIDMRPSTEYLVHRLVMSAAMAYAVLVAIPFVAGIEVGLAIIGVLGRDIVPLVYLCTLAGLGASFLAGRLIPLQVLGTLLDALRFDRASELIGTIDSMDREARLAFLVEKAPRRFVPTLLRHRYLALAVALNLPGNFLVGGGGGLALAAGMSGLFSLPGFLVTVAAAVTLLPLAILVFGEGIL